MQKAGTPAMSTRERQTYWENVYQTKDEKTVSWFEDRPNLSLSLIHATGVRKGASIIDIGAARPDWSAHF
jgi:hypothetical protein